MEFERQCEREEEEEDKKAQREATGNQRREGRTQVAVTVEISRRWKVSMSSITKNGEDNDQKIRNSGGNRSNRTGDIAAHRCHHRQA